MSRTESAGRTVGSQTKKYSVCREIVYNICFDANVKLATSDILLQLLLGILILNTSYKSIKSNTVALIIGEPIKRRILTFSNALQLSAHPLHEIMKSEISHKFLFVGL